MDTIKLGRIVRAVCWIVAGLLVAGIIVAILALF